MDKFTIQKYNDNAQIKGLIEQVIDSKYIKKMGVAAQLNMSRQNFSKLMNKKNINLDDLKRIMDVLGYDISITLTKKD